MGVIKRQGIASGIFIYIGVIVGFINTALLFPKILGAEILGFTQVLMSASGALGILALAGQDNVLIRYFPYFKDPERGHQGILFFVFSFVLLGLVLVISLVLIFKSSIIGLFSKEASRALTEEYYFLLPPMIIFNNFNLLFSTYAAALLRTRVPTFISDVFRRFLTLFIILLFFFGIIDITQFLVLFVGCFFAVTAGLFAYIIWMKQWFFKINFNLFKGKIFKEMLVFGSFSVLSKFGSQLIQRVDMLMVGAMLDYGAAGVYAPFLFISMLIILPFQGLGKITRPIIAEAWKEGDLKQLQSVFQRTALNAFAVGMLLFLGIWVNIDHAVTILGEEFSSGKYIALFLGIAQLVQIVYGYNMAILINSPSFKLDFVIKLLMGGLTIASNYFLIIAFGVVGAGIATALTFLIINLIIQLVLYKKYRLHPFSKGTLKIVAIGGVTYFVGVMIPSLNQIHFMLDLFVRSAVMTLIFVGLVIYFKISPDINAVFRQVLRKLG